MEKEHTLAQTSEKLELIDGLRDALKEKEEQHKEVADKLLQTENRVMLPFHKRYTLNVKFFIYLFIFNIFIFFGDGYELCWLCLSS